MSKSTYTNKFFISEVRKAYFATGQRPQMRQFSWSTSAHRRFGSWDELLRRAGIVRQLNSFEVEELNREKDRLWKELLLVTYNPEWYLNQANVQQTERLRKAIDGINQELSENYEEKSK